MKLHCNSNKVDKQTSLVLGLGTRYPLHLPISAKCRHCIYAMCRMLCRLLVVTNSVNTVDREAPRCKANLSY